MNLGSIFSPSSIAIIGASSQEKSVGNDVVKNLVQQGYQGKIFPVNPKIDTLYDLKVYHDINDIPEPIDLVVIAVPAKIVPEVLERAGQKKIPGAIVISAGFKEVGEVGLEHQLQVIAEKYDIALIGPNCLGVINPYLSMNASFAPAMPEQGGIAFISQSGALCTSALDYAVEFRMGFSKFLSTGNKAVIDEVTLLEYLLDDPETKVIAMYVEQLKDAQKFITIAQKLLHASPPKPIVILKAGRTQEGGQAMASHTGALSTEDRVYDALFSQAGVVRANIVRELFEYADMFARNPFVPVNSIAVVTNAGGPGVLVTDEAIKHGLKLSQLSDETVASLKQVLPPAANTHNPIDMLGDATAQRYKQTLDILENDKQVDAILAVLTPQSMTEIEETAQVVVDFKQRSHKPIVASFMGQHTVFPGVLKMEAAKVNTTPFPELAARGLAVLGQTVRNSQQQLSLLPQLDHIQTEKVHHIFEQKASNGKKSLPPLQVSEVLENYGIHTTKSIVVYTAEEAQQQSENFSGAVVLKIVSPDIEHKSDAGGVVLNVLPNQVQEKFSQLIQTVKSRQPNARIEGVMMTEMIDTQGIEMIVGAKKVPGLGTIIMVGLGGIYVEVFQDIQLGFTPLTIDYALHMIHQLQSNKILQGVRGQPPADVAALVDCIVRVSELTQDFAMISEIDLNPVLVLKQGKGVKILDARIII